jgi:hypothetical protein
MKKNRLKLLTFGEALFLSLVLLVSCENFETDHEDYKYTSGFFPYQYPVRTLVLGDYIYDNSNDNAHKFVISVAMGGVYENEKDRNFAIQVDESLCNNLLFTAGGSEVKPLPASMYSLSSTQKITIPTGKMNGGVEVQLADAFFNDPLAITLGYVVPVRLISSADVDTILSGLPARANPILTDASHWSVLPKNYTLFAVKYVNEYHGTYFHYGTSSVKDATGNTVENTTYSEKYVENNPVVKLTTAARYQVSLNMNLHSTLMPGMVDMLLDFTGNNCTISAAPGSAYTISGTGEFKSKAYTWGNKQRDGIVLNFTVSNGTYTYQASDVLVVRDRGIVMETFSPVVSNN